MKNGIELIAEERQEQRTKHHRSVLDDVIHNNQGQLSFAAQMLSHPKGDVIEWDLDVNLPNWNREIWSKMIRKPYKERLIIAGALIAAEIDRIQNS